MIEAGVLAYRAWEASLDRSAAGALAVERLVALLLARPIPLLRSEGGRKMRSKKLAEILDEAF